MDKKKNGSGTALRLPVVALGAEYLVMGHLMRRNILAYKAPPNNEGYDLICIHPDPKTPHLPGQVAQVRVQVKSRYATDCDRSFPVKERTFGAFDFLTIAFLNIGRFYRGRDGSSGAAPPEFYTFPRDFIERLHQVKPSGWEKVKLRGLAEDIEPYRDERGFEQIASSLSIRRPTRR